MLETIQSAFDRLQQISSESPVIAGAISLYGLAVLTYLMRGVPSALWKLLKRHTTTSLTMTSNHLAFHNFMEWLHKEGFSDKLRSIKVTNGRWGESDGAVKGAGFGTHFVWYRKRPLMLSLQKQETVASHDKEVLTITKLGRSHELFNRLVRQFAQVDDITDKVIVYTFMDDHWRLQQRQYKRDLASVFLSQSSKETLLEILNNFKESEAWYIEHGIPYRLGILLYGPPGTGKTSLIKSIAAHTDKNLCILPAFKLGKLLTAAELLPENSLMVIEDVDSNPFTHVRTSSPTIRDKRKKEAQEDSDFDMEFLMTMMDGGLSEILNAIDGISDTHGRILVLTTNNPDQLDKALLRPGRIDLTLGLDYVTYEIFVQFMSAFFPDFEVPTGLTTKEGVTVSKLQQCVLLKESPSDICARYLVREGLRPIYFHEKGGSQ